MQNKGKRHVPIRFLNGNECSLEVDYYAKRNAGRKKNHGFYPSLYLLGIHDRCTPALASEVSMKSAALSSFEETQDMLSAQGSYLNVKTIRNITKRYAARARAHQLQNETKPFTESHKLKGRHLVVSTDGGRIRIRKDKRGKKTKKGRKRYHTEWREPKLLNIYIVNDEGKLDKQFCPFIDGTLKGPNEIFGLIKYYLKKLDVTLVDKVLFVADGAPWIWNRVEELFDSLGLNKNQVYELLDYYHAVQHLNNLAKLKRLSEKERKKWVRKRKNELSKGKLSKFFESIKEFCKGSKSHKIKTERDYFLVKHKDRLGYSKMSDMKLPLGSGSMESSIRRVVNLRMKGPCIFWKEDTAEELLFLRCYYKSRRWKMINDMACQSSISAVL